MVGLLVGLKYRSSFDLEISIEEIKQLALACAITISETVIQEASPNNVTYIGSGKLNEIAAYANAYDVVIFNEELTPLQMRNITDLIDVPVLDRTDLILRIFESRAATKEAKLQVRMARLNYELPRLAGAHSEIYSQQGGSGFRGAGEQQLELERRRIRKTLASVRRQLKEVKKDRQTQRKRRSTMKCIALVGYTNSGKSSLLNLFTSKKVESKDMLFATLQTATRKVMIKEREALMIDTVGFISQLPHFLIEAFKSTLEEVTQADLIVFVIDSSSDYIQTQINVTTQVLKELGVGETPILYVYNKCDLPTSEFLVPKDPHVFISVKDHLHLDDLEEAMARILYQDEERLHLLIPYEEGRLYQRLRQETTLIKERFAAEGIHLLIEAPAYYREQLKEYLIS